MDTGYIVAGYIYPYKDIIPGFHGFGDAWVLKLNSIGDTIWTKMFNYNNFITVHISALKTIKRKGLVTESQRLIRQK